MLSFQVYDPFCEGPNGEIMFKGLNRSGEIFR